jgi:CRISPR-associated protein Cas5d
MKVERVSYDIITPSAARGVIEAIYWKPEIRWRINRIHVLNPIRFTSLRRNELASKVPAVTVARAMKAGRGNLGLYVEEDRQQRAATILRDVTYVIEANFEILSGEPNVGKHLDQFNRRARDGRCFQRPYLGCREFPAHFTLIGNGQALPEVHRELRGERDLGYLLHDIDFADGMTPSFFQATLRDGVLDVSPFQAKEERP